MLQLHERHPQPVGWRWFLIKAHSFYGQLQLARWLQNGHSSRNRAITSSGTTAVPASHAIQNSRRLDWTQRPRYMLA